MGVSQPVRVALTRVCRAKSMDDTVFRKEIRDDGSFDMLWLGLCYV